MKALMRYRGLLVLVLWQAPIGTDDEGRTRFGFGFGAGQLEYERLACGQQPSYSTTSYRHAGAEIEHFATKRTRLHASASFQSADSSSSSGPFVAFTLGFEGRKFGIGGGPAFVPGVEDHLGGDSVWHKKAKLIPAPSAYVRVGGRDALHVRAEIYPPSVSSASEAFRLVVGYNLFDTRRPSFTVGYTGIHENASESIHPGIVAEWFQPISRSAAIGLHAFTAGGVEHRNTGVTARLRLNVN